MPDSTTDMMGDVFSMMRAHNETLAIGKPHMTRHIDQERAMFAKRLSPLEKIVRLRGALTDCEWAIVGFVEQENLDASEPCSHEELCASEFCATSGCLIDRLRNIRQALSATQEDDNR